MCVGMERKGGGGGGVCACMHACVRGCMGGVRFDLSIQDQDVFVQFKRLKLVNHAGGTDQFL